MVPKLRQRDLKPLHSWFSEDTQPRANRGFYSTLCFVSTSNICFNPPSFQVPVCAERLGLVSRLREPSGLIESCIF